MEWDDTFGVHQVSVISECGGRVNNSNDLVQCRYVKKMGHLECVILGGSWMNACTTQEAIEEL